MISKAVQSIQQGKCVVFPTETVYGLGANALSTSQVAQIFAFKNRPTSNPLIVHVANMDMIFTVASSLSSLEQRLFEAFSPGPLTLVLPKKENVPSIVTGNLDSVGVRIPNHPIALDFLNAVNLPICAPSANISGKPSPTTYEMAKHYMKNQDVIILDGGNLEIGIESTVIKVERDEIYLLRAGAISPQMIADFCGIMPIIKQSEAHRSPGTKFTHYKPKAKVHLYTYNTTSPFTQINNAILLCLNLPLNTQYKHIYHFTDIQEYMHHLYEIFFQADKKGISHIICELPINEGLGMGLYDRLSRAGEN